MESRGGVTGGATLTDFLGFFERQGYTGSFLIRADAQMECANCGAVQPAKDFPVKRLRRVEGVSDPADMCIVAAATCPVCDARGTFTACVGANCPPEEAAVLRALDHSERVTRDSEGAPDSPQDASLVNDTGWLRGPESG